ncbi:MAG TPA: 2-C-methyl-D-erythritol 4-phosphate cytidylyltransferase [Aquifex aeolicus]|nr:2-C-methyl-D-erythritol 4-phosphate cytidylyltransferase [Aquifex aeolicus]
MNTVIILAAGEGRRVGFRKQFAEVCGKPLFMYSLEKVLDVFEEVILVLPEEFIDKIRVHPKVKKVPGGKERQDSVFNALLKAEGEIVVIHDAARPLTSRKIFLEVMDLDNYDGKIVACPARDTLKEVVEGRVVKTLNRSVIWHAQTPQAFKRKILLECHMRARAEGFVATDDAGLLEKYGYKVGVIEGGYWNVKITYPEDLEFIRKILCR